jgi:hypothetical protein
MSRRRLSEETMKSEGGESLQKFLDGFDADGSYKFIKVVQNAWECEKFSGLRAQLFKHYKTIFSQRFPVRTLLSKEQNAMY